ncbi:hypothetical protein ACMGE7_06555 [Macrococcus equi]|uniref:hypothetical protein n=1 Tax=Macrococcus equi TaxID=3395462 RepID=UPI0039BE8B98
MKYFTVKNSKLDNMNLITPIISLLLTLGFIFVNIHTLSIRHEKWAVIACSLSLIIFIISAFLNCWTIYLIIKRKYYIKEKK